MGDPFEAIVGVAHVERPAAARLAGARVDAVVWPADAHELAACLRAASEAKLAIVACGGGTRQHLGNPLDSEACVRLELGRIADHVDVNRDEGIATLDAGVRIGALGARLEACAKTSLLSYLPAEGTVGGALAADPFGPDWTLDRRLPNDVLGIEVALANGALAAAGGRVVKNVTGFDLVRLYCGSLGTLGVITRATFRLRALPECERIVSARFASLEAGLLAVVASAAVSAELFAAALRVDGEGAELLVRLVGDAKAVEHKAAQLPGESAPLETWARLRAALATVPAAGRARVRLSARPSDVAGLCRVASDVAGAAALRAVLPLAGSVVVEVEDAQLPLLSAAAERADAVFFAERAPGAGAAPCDVYGAAPDSLALMRAVKARFDPQRVLSPGRFVGGI
jgi:glycolate oxidase FAD binding subunit